MRTLVDIPPADRAWLDKKAKQQGISMAEALRQTLKAERLNEQQHARFMQLTKQLQGTWTQGDGLAWQMKMRSEWAR